MTRPLRAGVVGYGYMGQIRHRNIANNPDTELAAICDPFCRDAVISETSKAKIQDLQSRMVVKGQEISAKIQELYQRDKTIFDKMDVNNAELKKKISQYMRTVMGKNTNSKMLNPTSLTNKNSMKEGMQNLDMSDINGMLADTDLRVLQENYSYVLWSVLAVGLLTITINVMKASNK